MKDGAEIRRKCIRKFFFFFSLSVSLFVGMFIHNFHPGFPHCLAFMSRLSRAKELNHSNCCERTATRGLLLWSCFMLSSNIWSPSRRPDGRCSLTHTIARNLMIMELFESTSLITCVSIHNDFERQVEISSGSLLIIYR